MIGKILGNRYELLQCVGEGGMSFVYKARCRKLNRFVAVKILKDEFKNNEDMINFCMNNIAYNVSGTSDYEIEVMSVDYKEGMLDIIVTEKYTNVVGKEKKITIRKAAIYG